MSEFEDILARRAASLAVKPTPPKTGQSIEILIFQLGREYYGLEVKYVREIHALLTLTAVPRTPDFVAGVFNARGRILSAVDVKQFLGLGVVQRTEQTKIIIVTDSATQSTLEIGLLADMVVDLVSVFKEKIEPPLPTQAAPQIEFIQGITHDGIVVLNLQNLLSDKRLIIHEDL